MFSSLNQLAQIKAGLTFRGRLSTYPDGYTGVIQASAINSAGGVDISSLPRIEINKLAADNLVQSGDLIFCPRGTEGNDIYLAEKIKDEVVISTPLLLIRPDQSKVLSEYIKWYLEQPEALRQMNQYSVGTVIRKVGKKTLEQVTMPTPSLERQSAIVKVMELEKKEQQLLTQLREKRKQLISDFLMQIALEKIQ